MTEPFRDLDHFFLKKRNIYVEYAAKSPMEAVIMPWQPRREFGAKIVKRNVARAEVI
jgi:hypothetical protein